MSHGATVSAVGCGDGVAADFLMRFSDVVEQEARKIGRRCFHLATEDLYSQGMLHLVERLSYFLEADNPQPYIRIAVRRYLARYAFVNDSLIRTPASGHVERQVEQMFCMSLDEPVEGSEEEGITFADLMEAPAGNDCGYGSIVVALDELSQIQRQAIELRFGGNEGRRLMSFGKIARVLGVSRSAAFRLVQEGLEVLRRELVVEEVVA